MAARVLAQGTWPYTSVALFSLRFVESDQLPTMAVDDGWRLYYSPDFVLSCTVDQLATVVLHEVQHVLLDHSGRFRALNQRQSRHTAWNIAGDVVINDALEKAKLPFPAERGVRYEDYREFGVKPGQSTEQVFFTLLDQPSVLALGSDAGDGGSSSGSSAGVPAEDRAADDGWDCGSAVDGVHRDYEIPGDDEVGPAISRSNADLIRDRVAQDVMAAGRARGDVPGLLIRWAEELLNPVVDWRKVLAQHVRAGLASRMGRRDFSYRFPSRRSEALRPTLRGAILPAMRQPPPPRIAVVVDTSGSISEAEMADFLSEVLGITRAVGISSGITVVPCDARAYEPVAIRSANSITGLKLPGGGGTNMGAGIAAAVELRPKPDLVIVMTDGYTPWPAEPPQGNATFIVALTNPYTQAGVPTWATSLVIPREKQPA